VSTFVPVVAPSRTLRTADGTNTGAFDAGDWALTLAVATIWGSSFLWTAIGLDSLDPATVALLRITLGAVALWAYPSTRRTVDRTAWPGIVVVAVAGNAGPALLFAIAQQHVESSVAGMINAATPLAALVVTILLTRHTPGYRQVAGLLVGLLGISTMTAPNLVGASAEPLGIMLLLVAVAGYGTSNNIIVPLQQAYGAPAIIGRALIIGSLLLAPLGVFGLSRSDLTAGSIAAVTVLGVIGTGVARALNATLAGRTGAPRGALTTYLAPVLAIALGVLFRNDQIEATELAGTALVLAGAFLTSRRQRTTTRTCMGVLRPRSAPGIGRS
jgi:drug/metabolite transporter (DMT)-like permease